MKEIFEEDEGQSEWSLEVCHELLGEVTAEKTRAHASVEEFGEPMEDVGQENLKKLPPDTNESCANDAAMEICTRDTASIDLLTKDTPVDGVVAANEKLARQKWNSSSEIGSKQLNEISKKIRAHESGEKRDEPMKDVGKVNLSKSLPNKPENFANESATVEM